MRTALLNALRPSTNSRHHIFLLAFILVYFLNLFIGKQLDIKQTGEVIPMVVIFGVIFPLLAWFITRNYKTSETIRPVQSCEAAFIASMVLYISVVIILGNKLFLLPDQQGATGEMITLIRKVVTFVLVPFLLYRVFYKFSLADFGLSLKWKKVINYNTLFIWAVFSALLLLLNYFAGTGAKPLREGIFSANQLLKAVPLFSIWLLIEVGLVEEFFFRGLLQNRLGAILRSKTGAICISALIFGLVHAPGMYLRQAGVDDGLGTAPALLNSIVYCIAIQSIPGLFLGILLEKTRNLWLLMAIHAMFDLLPGLSEFIKVWGI